MKVFLAVLPAFLCSFGLVFANDLDDLAQAMGADKVKSISYAGEGYYYNVGQNATPQEPWPKFNLKSFQIRANYDTGSMDRELVITQFLDPPRGGGFQPIRGERKIKGGLEGDVGWTYRRGKPGPARSTVNSKHTLWTTPHGIIKAAQAAKASVKTQKGGGRTFKTVTFGQAGVFTTTAWFDDHNLLTKAESQVAHPVFGDMPVVMTYSDYKDFDGVKFPTRMTATSWGSPSLELNVTRVEPNAPADISPPEGLRARSERVKVEKITDGVWFLTGGSHHSIAIEMADHVIVFEGPLYDQRSLAVMAAVEKTIPGKPIRFVVNTHSHFDHSGGLRAYAGKGATIVTDEINKPFYEQVYAAPNKLMPDVLTKSGKKAKVLGFKDKHVLSDGKRSLELYRLRGNQHNEGLIIGYLPKEKILMVADAYSGRRMYKEPAKRVGMNTANLWENLQRLNLDIETVLPIHGGKADFQQLKFAAGQQ